jgi:DNA-binding Xre family transcriptional regulator
MKHTQILENLLKERQISKKDFAVSIGYSPSNYSVVFGKEIFSQKLISLICEKLEVDESVFEEQENDLNMFLALKLIESQNEQINLLREKIAVLEAKQ